MATAHESWGLFLAGGCSVLAETVVERVRGGLGGKGLLPRSPQPSHAHACPPAVNNTLLTTGSHLIPTASLPPLSLGKTGPEVPSAVPAFWEGEGGEDPHTLGCKWPAGSRYPWEKRDGGAAPPLGIPESSARGENICGGSRGVQSSTSIKRRRSPEQVTVVSKKAALLVTAPTGTPWQRSGSGP